MTTTGTGLDSKALSDLHYKLYSQTLLNVNTG